MEFVFPCKYMKLCGFLSPLDSSPSKLMRIWNVISIIPFIVLHALIIPGHVANAHILTELYHKMISLFLMSHGLMTIFRRFYFVARREFIVELLQLFEERPSSDADEEFLRLEQEMRVTSSRRIRRLCLLNYIVVFVAILLKVGLYLGYRTVATLLGYKVPHILLYVMWWFTDKRQTPTYYYIMVWQSFVAIANFAITCAENSFTSSCIIAVAERSAFLARTAPQYLLPSSEDDRQVSAQFITWVKYHQHYLKIVNKVNEFVGPLVFMTHFSAFLTVVSHTYFFFKIHELVMALSEPAVIITVMLQFLILSAAGQSVIDSSVEVSTRVLSQGQQVSRGLLHPGPACSAFSVLVTRLSAGNNFEAISGMGFFVASMESLQSILSAAFSYLLVLFHFQTPGSEMYT